MFTVSDVLSGVRCGELRTMVFGQQSHTDPEKFNVLVSAINSALNDLNTKMLLRRDVYSFNYLGSQDSYVIADPALEQILAVQSAKTGDLYRLNASTMGGIGERVQDVVHTLAYNRLTFPTPQYDGEQFIVHIRTSMPLVQMAIPEIPELEQATDLPEKMLQLIELPRVFLEAVVQYVAHKILQNISPDIEGKKDIGEYFRQRYEAIVAELKMQGFGNSHMPFSTDMQYMNSQII